MYDTSIKSIYNENVTHKVTITGIGASDETSERYLGESVTINAGTKEGYRFIRWECNNESVAFTNNATTETTFIMPEADIAITAVWEIIKYKVTVQNSQRSDDGSGEYAPGTEVTIRAKYISSTDYPNKFHHWEVISGGVTITNVKSDYQTFIMPASDVVIKCVWNTEISHTLTIGGEAEGVTVNGVAVTSGDNTYRFSVGQSINIVASRDGMKLTEWTDSNSILAFGENYKSNITIRMPDKDAQLIPNWAIGYKLTVYGDENPSVVGNNGIYAEGETVSLEAPSTRDYEFTRWVLINDPDVYYQYGETERYMRFSMPAKNLTVGVEMKKKYELFVRETPIRSSTSTETAGTVITKTASGTSTKRFVKWVPSANITTFSDPTLATITFTMPEGNASMNASFETI